jgi:hypothetical protein
MTETNMTVATTEHDLVAINNSVGNTTNNEAERKIVIATKDMDIPNFQIQKTEEYKSVAQFINLLRCYRFNDPIQRNANAWLIDAKSLLIISILEEISIGEITVQVIRVGKMIYRNILDGKQRLTTIRDYVKGKYALNSSRFVNGYDEAGELIWVNVNGLYFDDLPQFYKDRILATMLKFDLYEIDDEMKFELFQRRNNGVALKPAQLRKSIMTYELLSTLAELKDLPVFTAGFTPLAINNDTHADMILKAMAVLITSNNTALGNTDLNKLLEGKAFVPTFLKEFRSISDYVCNAFLLLDEKSVNRCFGNSKTVALMYVAKIAMSEARSYEKFAEWIIQFFVKDYAKSNFGSQSGTAKIDSVRKRNDIIVKHYNHFFA